MKIQKNGKTVTMAREEVEMLVKHIAEFEKLVKALERADSAGKLSPDVKKAWASLKKFMDAEEERLGGGGGAGPTPRARKIRCCILSNETVTNIVKCQEFNSSLFFASSACILQAIVGGFDAQLVPGKCSTVAGCP